MTNKEAYEEGAGMSLSPEFFTLNGLDPEAEYTHPFADESCIDIITAFQNAGHTYHCSCRLVWGDGECECQGREKEGSSK